MREISSGVEIEGLRGPVPEAMVVVVVLEGAVTVLKLKIDQAALIGL